MASDAPPARRHPRAPLPRDARFLPGAGHLLFIERWEEILGALIAPGDFEVIQKRKRLRTTAHVEARPSPGVDEEAKSLRRRYRRFRAAQNRFDCPPATRFVI
jgi:hypothetical protein